MAEPQNNSNLPASNNNDLSSEEAANLIRERIGALHGQHQDDAQKRSHNQMTLLERFWHEHHSHPDKPAAWNAFYSGLNNDEKHQLWRESQAHRQPQESVEEKAEATKPEEQKVKTGHIVENDEPKKSKKAAVKRVVEKHKARLAPLLTAISVVMFVLIANYNELAVAQVKQYITPGTGQNSPTIIDPNSEVAVGKESRIIIPKINVDVPVVYDIKGYDEGEIQAGLERGVVHYGETGLPGKAGNNVIVGHSSNNFFNNGKYKFAFVLLDRMEINDTFILHYEGKRYIYKVFNKQVIEPNDFSLIQPTKKPVTTLITCSPPGTSWRRLVVQAEQISPEPTKQQTEAEQTPVTPTNTEIVPGNSPSLWSRFTDWLF